MYVLLIFIYLFIYLFFPSIISLRTLTLLLQMYHVDFYNVEHSRALLRCTPTILVH